MQAIQNINHGAASQDCWPSEPLKAVNDTAARVPKGALQGGVQGARAGTASSNTPQVSNQTKLQQLKPMQPQPQPPKKPR
jgi:hypothetical protein